MTLPRFACLARWKARLSGAALILVVFRAGATAQPLSGSTPVILHLRESIVPEARLDQSAASAQRQAIASRQQEVVTRLSRASDPTIKRYPLLPAVALHITPAERALLERDPSVEWIQEDRLHRVVLNESTVQIGAPAAWAAGDTGAGWTVAILDTGVDKAHPFLSGKVVSEACYSTTWGTSFASVCPGGVSSTTAVGSGVPCTLWDCGHGTHVAGIAAGSTAGLSGVAPAASVIAIQVFSREVATGEVGAFTSDIDLALQRVYALRASFRIASVNLSIGDNTQYAGACDSVYASTKAAIDLLASAGIATVIAAGNNGWTDSVSGPGCISTAVTVGSVTKGSVFSSFTNMGPEVDVLAPGTSILSSLPGGGYGVMSGTSMATPHVTGAWALLRQRNPSASVDQVLAALKQTGTTISDARVPYNGASPGLNSGFRSAPLIAIDRAVNALGLTAPELLAPASSTSEPSPVFIWRSVANATAYQLWVNDATGTVTQAWYNAAALGCTSTCQQRAPVSLAAGSVTWWVRGWSAELGDGPWSAGVTFQHVIVPPGTPTLLSPSGAIGAAAPAFTWTAVIEATHYLLWVNDASGVKLQTWYTAASVGCATGQATCSASPGIALEPGEATWWIETWNAAGGYGAWTAGMSFVVAAPAVPRAPTLLSPSGTVALDSQDVQYRWTEVPEATHYLLWVNDGTGTVIQQWYQAGGVCGSGLCSVTPAVTLVSGQAMWWIQTWNATGGYGPWSAGVSFAVR
jgi:subtilisin family serine protease